MKKTISMVLAAALFIAAIGLPYSASASASSVFDITFPNGAVSDAVPGNTWTNSMSPVFAGGRANFDAGGIELSPLANIANVIDSDQNWYLRFDATFNSFNTSNENWLFRFTGNQWDFIFTYVKSTNEFKVYLTDGSLTALTKTFPATLNTAYNYDIAVTRDANEIKVYVDNALAGTASIPADLRAWSDPTDHAYFGGSVDPFGKFTSSHATFVGGSAYDPSSSQPIAAAVVPSVIAINSTALSFGSVLLNNAGAMTLTSSNSATVIDDRGSGSGWSVAVSATDFESASLPDPSSGGGGSITVIFPINSLSLTSAAPIVIGGQAVDPLYGPKASDATLSNTAQTIVDAAPGYGMGDYKIDFTYTLNVPKTVQIKTLSGSGSKYALGSNIGLVATAYNSTITFTLGAGL